MKAYGNVNPKRIIKKRERLIRRVDSQTINRLNPPENYLKDIHNKNNNLLQSNSEGGN